MEQPNETAALPATAEVPVMQVPVAEIPTSTVVPTPHNTPLPGGGSWSWNHGKAEWQENTTPYAPPPAALA